VAVVRGGPRGAPHPHDPDPGGRRGRAGRRLRRRGEDKGEAAIAPAAASSTSRGSASGDAGTDDVRIVDFAFVPRTVRAKVGQKVKWEHQDAGVTHTVTALDRSFRSGDLEEGDEFSHLFPTAGTFAYRCSIHPDMRGRVKVSG
jgi:plastocyanin